MIRAEVGLRPKVTGMSSAIPAIGPRPGRIPTSVPTIAPIRQYSRFCAVAATVKPPIRYWSDSSIRSVLPSQPEPARGQRNPEPVHEDDLGEARTHQGDQSGDVPLADAENPYQHEHQHK